MPKLTALAISISALALVACTTVGPDFSAPATPADTSYLMPGDPDAPSSTTQPYALWWKAFGSSDIDQVVDQSLKQNYGLAEADAALARTQALARATQGGGAPQIDYRGSAERERVNTSAFGIDGFPSPTISLYSVGTAASFDLDVSGGQRRRNEGASARAEAAAHRRDAAYLALSGNVVARAIDIAELRALIAASEQVVSDDQRLLALVQRAIEAGGQPQSAEVTAQAQLAEDEARLPPLRARLAAARHALAVLAGQTPSGFTAPNFSLDAIASPGVAPIAVPSELVRRRPDILAAESELHAATADIGVATAALYPKISLGAVFDLTALSPDTLFNYESSGWSAGPSMTGPLFHGGALRAGKRASEAARDEALARYHGVVLTAFAQVSDLLQAASQARALVDAQTRAVAAADRRAHLSERAYENGADSLLTVIDARRQAQRARLDLVAAQAALRRNEALLFVASAADWRKS